MISCFVRILLEIHNLIIIGFDSHLIDVCIKWCIDDVIILIDIVVIDILEGKIVFVKAQFELIGWQSNFIAVGGVIFVAALK